MQSDCQISMLMPTAFVGDILVMYMRQCISCQVHGYFLVLPEASSMALIIWVPSAYSWVFCEAAAGSS